VKTISGNFILPNGDPAAGAAVTFLLDQDASCSVGQIIHERITVTLDQNGALPPNFQLFGNDELLTAGTFYFVSVVDPIQGRVFFERMVLAGSSPVNLNIVEPLT
jgi:hypothetical protein